MKYQPVQEKKQPDNLSIGAPDFSAGVFVGYKELIYGGIAVDRPFEKAVWLFGIMVSLINLGEEIAADAMDVEGDRAAGSRSLPVLLGRENALKISGSIFLSVILVSCLPFLLGWVEWIYFFPILAMDVIISFSIIKLLDAKIANRRIYIRWIYLSGLAAILIFIILRMVR